MFYYLAVTHSSGCQNGCDGLMRRRRRRGTSLSRRRSLHPEEALGGAEGLERGEESSQCHGHKRGFWLLICCIVSSPGRVSEQHHPASHWSNLRPAHRVAIEIPSRIDRSSEQVNELYVSSLLTVHIRATVSFVEMDFYFHVYQCFSYEMYFVCEYILYENVLQCSMCCCSINTERLTETTAE